MKRSRRHGKRTMLKLLTTAKGSKIRPILLFCISMLMETHSLMKRLNPDPATSYQARDRRTTIKTGAQPLEVLWEVKRLLDLVRDDIRTICSIFSTRLSLTIASNYSTGGGHTNLLHQSLRIHGCSRCEIERKLGQRKVAQTCCGCYSLEISR